MKLPVYLVDESGTRRVEPDEFPLALPGTPGAQTAAHIGSSEGELFVQPASSDLPVLCNGTLLKTSHWLRDGDVVRLGKTEIIVELGEEQIRLRVEKWKAAQKTDPPVLPPTERPPTGMSDISGASVKPITFEPIRVGPTHRERTPIRTREMVLWASLVLLAAAAYFVFTARAVLVETEPGEAQIDFQDTYFKLELGGRYLLRQGEHTVAIEKEGYRRIETEVTVTDERNQRLLFVLQKRPGILVLSTVPAKGAVVTIDGEEIGVTPVAEVELSPWRTRSIDPRRKPQRFLDPLEHRGRRHHGDSRGGARTALGRHLRHIPTSGCNRGGQRLEDRHHAVDGESHGRRSHFHADAERA